LFRLIVLTAVTALYLLLTAYKWYTFLDDDERPLADRILRRGERPRQIRSLVTLFVRDEAAVFFIITSSFRDRRYRQAGLIQSAQ
jgi:hypothetical protein